MDPGWGARISYGGAAPPPAGAGAGVRAESLRAGSENMPDSVTFWPTL